MTKNQVLVVRSWTSPDDTTLLLVSSRPISVSELDQARISMVGAMEGWQEPEYEPGVVNNPKRHRKLMKFLKKVAPSGFQILEVGEFTIV